MKIPLTKLKGIGATRAAAFEKLGITDAEALLSYYPRSYEDHSVIKNLCEIAPYESCSVVASVVTTPTLSRIRKGLDILRFTISDGTASCKVTYFNQPYLKTSFVKGETYLFYGRFEGNFINHTLTNPYFEKSDIEAGGSSQPIKPIYTVGKGLTQKAVVSAVHSALDMCEVDEYMPSYILDKYKLPSLKEALDAVHRPENMAQVKYGRNRLIFDEFLMLSLGLFMKKSQSGRSNGAPCKMVEMAPFYDALGYDLTDAQQRSINEGISDMCGVSPMNRLVQGDVGSGKTAVSAALCYFAIKNGWQSAIIAPTEILAKQHYEKLSSLFANFGMSVSLLTGSTKKKEREVILKELVTGKTDLMIATHALMVEDVIFERLGLLVCDEQHRFGVRQRAAAVQKGKSPHLLVMSATPIPRTLALMIYGDLEISVIDTMPPGRRVTKTHYVTSKQRGQINSFINKKLSDGEQGYVVCPLVEGSDGLPDVKDAVSHRDELKRLFPDVGIGLIHGRMKPAEKEEEMKKFVSGESRILIATTVIEVGVDVRNATFMIIENAERFGLSQLHQLRGRVGRGNKQSYCIIVSDHEAPDTVERLKVLESTADGFEIAKRDLELRGPGDFFGSRQHGLPTLRIADMAGDTVTLHAAQETAKEIYRSDPNLLKEEHRMLKIKTQELFSVDKASILN